VRATFSLRFPLALGPTLALQRHGRTDPTIRLSSHRAVIAMRTPVGSATVDINRRDGEVEVEAWGPGSEWAVASVPRLLGLDDDPSAFAPETEPLRELHRRHAALRIGGSGRVMAALVPAILEQKVTGKEAKRSWAALVRAHGEPAPGPHDLLVPPAAEVLAGLAYHDLHRFGVERKRAEAIRAVARLGERVERLADGEPEDAYRFLRSIRGIGAWTAAEVGMAALGDPDAVSVGDYHLKHEVCFVLAGETTGTDERMLELLAPYEGQRGRACRLISLAGLMPPRRGPRRRLRSIQRL
jgi:3-methyladenine DNA glycosylase/8-oxoguanine DNA glycosylase